MKTLYFVKYNDYLKYEFDETIESEKSVIIKKILEGYKNCSQFEWFLKKIFIFLCLDKIYYGPQKRRKKYKTTNQKNWKQR